MLWLWPAGIIQGILESLTDAKGTWDRLPPTLCFPPLSCDGRDVLGERSSSRDTGKPSGETTSRQRYCSTSTPRPGCQPAHMEEVFCCRKEQVGGHLLELPPLRSAFTQKGKEPRVGQAAPVGLLCCRMPVSINISGAWRLARRRRRAR